MRALDVAATAAGCAAERVRHRREQDDRVQQQRGHRQRDFDTIVITGHCASLLVSGMKNLVTVDAADSIEASGMNNQVTYRSGAPKISNSGVDNTVTQG